jgi:PiT family inorganic phosphate transporter
MTASLIVLVVGAVLAYANGANDVSKGIATLVGSGIADYRRAIVWGTIWTGIGGLLGAVLAGAMLATFGKGLLLPGTTATFAAALSALAGAAGWVLFATRASLPVSTTHGIVGSLVGVSVLTYGLNAVKWSALAEKVLLPLLVSPLVSLIITAVILRATRNRHSVAASADCLCARVETTAVAITPAFGDAVASLPQPLHLRLTTGQAEACARTQPAALRLTIDHLHWLTSGATSLARGMNDGPKIVALVVAASALLPDATLPAWIIFGLVAVAMVGGSAVAGRRVTHVLAEKVTAMDHREGFSANLVTAGLVTVGAIYGLPMSTTHVSAGGIFCAGALRGSLNRKTLRDVLLAWVITLPGAALMGMATYAFVRLVDVL